MDEIEHVIEGLNLAVNKLRDYFFQLTPDASGHHVQSYHINHHQDAIEVHSSHEHRTIFESILETLHIQSHHPPPQRDIELHSATSPTEHSEEPEIVQRKLPPHQHTLMDTFLETLHLKAHDEPTPLELSVLHFHSHADVVQKHLLALQKMTIRKYHQKPVHRVLHG